MTDPNEEWRRLQALYRQMSDDELLGLLRDRDNLTPVAQQALDGETTSRSLTLPADDFARPSPGDAAELNAAELNAAELTVATPEDDDPSQVLLTTFPLAHEASLALGILAAQDIPARLRPTARRPGNMQQVLFDLLIDPTRRDDAILALRKGMGWFPADETESPTALEDGGDPDPALYAVGSFDSEADAEVLAHALQAAAIPFHTFAHAATSEDPAFWVVEVDFDDLDRAEQVMEHAFPGA